MEYLYRRNTVFETLRAGRRTIKRLWLQKGVRQAQELVDAAKSSKIPIQTTDKQQLTKLVGDKGHQGVVLEVGPYPYAEIEDMMALAASRGERPFVLLLFLLHGPQNIGTLLRAAEACGVHGIILQDRRAPDITPSVVMYSAGATEHLLITQVTNLAQTIQRLKAEDIWIVGMDLDEEAFPLNQVDLDIPLGIVIGHEGQGLRRLVRERCDYLVMLPMRGQVASLNAATAGAVMLYSAWQARGYEGTHSKS
jgi:23S rRNA (guanosine2251-2'-O)-methyltransferase